MRTPTQEGQRPGRTDTASLEMSASPLAVYDALTDACALATWLPPRGMTGEVHVLEPRRGGRFHMTLRYEDPQSGAGKSTDDTDVVDAQVADLVPGERVVWSVRFDSEDPALGGIMRMSWLLEPLVEGTKVTILAEDVPPGIGAEAHAEGLRSSLEHLAAFLGSDRATRLERG